jgi:TPR repeat protein
MHSDVLQIDDLQPGELRTLQDMRRSAFAGAVLAAGLAIGVMAAGAVAQGLEDVEFDKKLTLAKVGDEEAQMAVAEAYESGTDAKQDLAEAAKWYRQAALQGNIEAQYRLARIVAKGAKGLTADMPTALKLYEAAAEKGNAEAQNSLGRIYQTGQGGVAADPVKAADYYKKAAAANLAAAQNNLGMLYLKGSGVRRDLKEAFRLFELAAAQNYAWGQNNLGGMYEMGWGTGQDKAKALELYKQALANGIAQAQENIRRIEAPAAEATETPDAGAATAAAPNPDSGSNGN